MRIAMCFIAVSNSGFLGGKISYVNFCVQLVDHKSVLLGGVGFLSAKSGKKTLSHDWATELRG